MLGLELFDETKALTQVVAAVHEQLESAHEAANKLIKPRRKAKRVRDLAEWRAERVVDEVASQCEAADGHRPRGATARAMLPDGVGPVKAPKGREQVRKLEKLANDLEASADAKVKAIATSLVTKLREAASALATSETDFQAARKVWREAEDLEDLRLAEHRRTMDSILGEIRKLFPGDRGLQDLITPDIDDAEERGDAGGTNAGTGDAPARAPVDGGTTPPI